MALKNFHYYVDRGGKMPFISAKKVKVETHPYYIRYSNNKPVVYHGPTSILAQDVTQSKVYDYSTNEFFPIHLIKQE